MGGKTFAAALAAALMVAAAGGDDEPAARADADRLQGIWSMLDYQIDGSRSAEPEIRSWLLVVEGDEYNPGVREYSVEYTYRLRPGRTPKAIDLLPRAGSSRNQPIRGIYKLEGDRLVLCYPMDPHGERPAGFSARAGSGLVRVTWVRRKPPTAK
jgi:uncharacterized protein (TIGR03067 family)